MDRVRGGRAALFGSGSQFVSQLSDLPQQLSLAAVQVGAASVQRNCEGKGGEDKLPTGQGDKMFYCDRMFIS